MNSVKTRKPGKKKAPSVTCAHCGVRDADAAKEHMEHFCLGAIFDWAQALDGEHRMREFSELTDLMDEFGVGEND